MQKLSLIIKSPYFIFGVLILSVILFLYLKNKKKAEPKITNTDVAKQIANAAATGTTTQTTNNLDYRKILKLNSKSAEVKELQRILNRELEFRKQNPEKYPTSLGQNVLIDYSGYTPLSIDGVFGERTGSLLSLLFMKSEISLSEILTLVDYLKTSSYLSLPIY